MNDSYLALATSSLRGILRVEDNQVTEDSRNRADKLERILKRRLAKHIQTKIHDTSKHNHPALLFVRANKNRFIALLCMYGQARKSPVMNANSCLLEHPSRGGFLLAIDRNLERSYLHYSEEDYH